MFVIKRLTKLSFLQFPQNELLSKLKLSHKGVFADEAADVEQVKDVARVSVGDAVSGGQDVSPRDHRSTAGLQSAVFPVLKKIFRF